MTYPAPQRWRRACASLVASVALLLGAAVPAAAQGPPEVGDGTATVTTSPIAPGQEIEFTGSGFATRPENNGLSIKVDDGAVLNPVGRASFGAEDLFANAVAVSGSGEIADGIRLPELGLPVGDHWLRFLAGAAGGPVVSKRAHFDVTAAIYPSSSLGTTGRVLSVSGEQTFAIRGYGETEGATVAIYSGGLAGVRLGDTTVAADGTWAWTGGVVPSSYADGAAGTFTVDVGDDGIADQDLPYTVQRFPTVRATPSAAAPGDTVTIRLSGARLGASAEVFSARIGGVRLVITDFARDDDGVSFKVTLPEEGLGLDTKIAVLQSVPYQRVIDVPVTVLELVNADAFDVASSQLVESPGNVADLYQVAYGAASGSVFATSACCFPPIAESTLFKLDPETLAVQAQVTPADSDSSGTVNLYGVYGVGTDDKHGTVWTTNTRQDTVAVYRQSDLGLVKQFPDGVTPHSRDVLIDEERNRAYVSDNTADAIGVFDTETLTQLATINLASTLFSGVRPMSLDLDPETGTLYSISLNPDPDDTEGRAVAIIITPRSGGSGYDVSSYPLDGTSSASGVAIDVEKGRLWAVSQSTEDNLVVIDLTTGDTVKLADAGAGALNAVFDPVNRLAYVSDRLADTISVWDEDGNLVGRLDGGNLPNHVDTDGNGTIFAVNKGSGDRGNLIQRIRPREIAFTGAPAVAGEATVGSTVSVGGVATAPADAELRYQWQLDGAPIAGATAASFEVPATAAGHALSVAVTASKVPWRATTATSAPATVPAPDPGGGGDDSTTPGGSTVQPIIGSSAPLVVSGARPSITGTARVGRTLRAVTGTWTGGATLSYQWLRNGSPIARATRATYTLAAADYGKRITVAVTGALAGYTSTTLSSAVTAKVARGVLTLARPAVRGSARVGATVRVSARRPAGAKLSYAWKAGGKRIAGARSSKLKLTSALRGKRVTVTVTATRGGYRTVTRTVVAARAVR